MKTLKLVRIEIFFFIFSIFFQDFAIFNTNDFGISFSFIFSLYIFIKLIYLNLYSVKLINFFLLILSMQFLSFFYNDNYINFSKISRLIIILFIFYNAYLFLKQNYSKHKEIFTNTINKFVFFSVFYGIYSIFANIYKLPLFLNILNNNVSYKKMSFFSYAGGWIDLPRIYGNYFEPSAYGMFMVTIFYIYNKINLDPKIYINSLIITNLIFTFSRSAYAAFIYSVFFILLYKIFFIRFNNQDFKKTLTIIYLLPFFNIYVMDFFKIIFTDLSSFGRTNSANYYLLEYLKEFPNLEFFIGKGIGSISAFYSERLYTLFFVESLPHNAFVEFIYEYGVILFIIVIIYLFSKTNKFNFKYLVVIFSILSFESYYNVESFLILFLLLYFIFRKGEKNKKNINNY